jgi:hypothetical protein
MCIALLMTDKKMIGKEVHTTIIKSTIDVVYGIKEKEIHMPDIGDGFQFSLSDNGQGVGVLRIDSDEKFNEFFELLKKSAFYEDFSKMRSS